MMWKGMWEAGCNPGTATVSLCVFSSVKCGGPALTVNLASPPLTLPHCRWGAWKGQGLLLFSTEELICFSSG